MVLVSSRRMSNQSLEPLLDDQLKAMERLERRHLLLRLATADQHTEPCIDFSDVKHTAGELDPLVTMHHLHLPILEEREYILWDRETDLVTKGPRFDELEPFLKLYQDLQRDLLAK